MHMRDRLGPWLVAALLAGGCNEICPTATPPAASCIRVAVGTGGQILMVITPECGIVDTDVAVASQFSGGTYTMHVDAEGRSPSLMLFSAVPDQLVLSWGGDCKTQFCAQINGPGPARECESFGDDFPE